MRETETAEAAPSRSMSSSHPSRLRARPLAWVLSVSVCVGAYYVFVQRGAQQDIWQSSGNAFGAQMVSFAFAALMLGWARHWSAPRPSDPGLIFLFWTACYFVYPSGYWIRGGAILFADFLYTDGHLVLLAHAVFVPVFMAVFILVSGRKFWIPPKIDASRLPAAGLLLLVPILALVGLALFRFASAGTIASSSNYGDQWAALSSGVQAARGGGSLGYLITQVATKIYFFPILALGIGGGIVGAKAFLARKGRVGWVLLLLAISVLTLLMGVAPRSGALMVVLISVILADMLTGLIRLRYYLPILLVLLVLFVFFQFFREVSDQGLGTAVRHSTSQLGESRAGQFDEFTLMLSKEVVAARYFATKSEGVGFVASGILSPIPSQLLPAELAREDTGAILSMNMLGAAAVARGGGVAGAVLADGFRVGGMWGIAIIAAAAASILGLFVRWMMASPGGGPQLLRVAMAAGYLAWGFMFVRGDLVVIMGVTAWFLVLPWVALKFLLPTFLDDRTVSQWLGTMPMVSAPSEGPQARSSE